MNSLGIIIPVYNEGANIGATLASIAEKISTPHTISIVYDFEEDNTLPVAKNFAEQGMDIALIRNRTPGVVHAIRTGLHAAQEPYLLVTMADLSDDYRVVDEMCRLMDQGYDVVCGSRYMCGGRQIGGPLVKKTLSRLASLSLKWLTGIPTHDITNSFKLYRKAVVESFPLESPGGFEIGMEITVKAFLQGFRITEVPCTWTDRTQGKSRFKLVQWAPNYLKWYRLAVISRRVRAPRSSP